MSALGRRGGAVHITTQRAMIVDLLIIICWSLGRWVWLSACQFCDAFDVGGGLRATDVETCVPVRWVAKLCVRRVHD